MARLRDILSFALGLLSILMLYVAMTVRPGGAEIPALAYVGLWVGAVAAMIAAYWLVRSPFRGDA